MEGNDVTSLAAKYLCTVRRSISMVQCVVCRVQLLPRHMNRHMSEQHHELAHFKCVWCMQYTWSGRVNKEVNKHRYLCLHRASSGHQSEQSIRFMLPDSGVTNLHYNNMEIDMWYEHNRLLSPPSVSTSIYDFIQSPDDDVLPKWLLSLESVDDVCSFRNEFPVESTTGFNPIWQKLFSFKRNLAWYHISIRFSAWKAFVDFLNAIQTLVVWLPYSCLCNAGLEHHRHLICVLELKNTRNVMFIQWNKFLNNEVMINLDVSKNPLQLMTTITELSSTTIACSLTKNSINLCHYYIFRPVIPFAEFFAMLYVPGGIDSYVRHRYSEAADFIGCRSLDEKEWSVEYRDIIKDIATIFPLPRHYQFTPYIGGESNFLYVGDFRFSVQCNDNLLKMTTLQWNVHQVHTGNCFVMNLGARRFHISKRLQKTISSIMTIIREKDHHIAELIQTLEIYKSKNNELLETYKNVDSHKLS